MIERQVILHQKYQNCDSYVLNNNFVKICSVLPFVYLARADKIKRELGREVVYMERPIKPNMGPSLADALLCTFESTNAGFSSFPVGKLLSWE